VGISGAEVSLSGGLILDGWPIRSSHGGRVCGADQQRSQQSAGCRRATESIVPQVT
jgi:hypothetical protein